MAKPGPKTMVGIRVDEKWVALLDRLSEEKGRSRSDVARSALELGLDWLDGKEPDKAIGPEYFDQLAESNRSLLSTIDALVKAVEKAGMISQESPKVAQPKPAKAARPKPEPEPEPVAEDDNEERRGPNRPRVDAWVAPSDKPRAQAHFVTSDTRNGFLGYACGKEEDATDLEHVDEPKKRCSKCEDILSPKTEKRSGPRERRTRDRLIGPAGRRSVDLLDRAIKQNGPETMARAANTTPVRIKEAVQDPGALTAQQWARIESSDGYKRANADLLGASK